MENNKDVKYAGFWVRVLASVIDGLVLTIPLSFIEVLFGEDSTVTLILFFIAWWFYTSRMLSSSWKATIGKRVVSIEVENENFEQLTFREATFRFLYSIISYVLIIPILMMLFSEKKQTLHDKMAKTIVLDSAEMSDGSTYSNVKFIRVIGYILLAILGAAQAYIMGMLVFFALLFSTQNTGSNHQDYQAKGIETRNNNSMAIQEHEKKFAEYIKKEKQRVKDEEKQKANLKKENKKLMYKIRKLLVEKDRDLMEIDKLLNQATNINMAFSDTNRNLLYTSVKRDDYNASNLFLEKGLDPKNSLSSALSDNTSIELFNLVIGYYLNPTDFEKTRSILYRGIYKKSAPEKIENILEYVEEINEKNQQHTSALGTAIEVCSSIETIKLLLSHGAKLNDDVKLVPLLRKSSYKCRYRKDIEEAMTPKRHIKQPVYKKFIRMD